MKQNYLFGVILSMALVFVMILSGCEYNGPSVDEISDEVVKKSPSSGDIADTVLERSEVSNYSQQIEALAAYGKLTIGKDITAWGQTNAAYTLAVNTAERQFFNLPTTTGLTWDGNGTNDIKRSDSLITLAEKSSGKTASFNFTIVNTVYTTKTIKGSLTVTTNYDPSTIGVANLNEFFEKLLAYDLDDDTATFTTGKPITAWGQTDAAYTITADIYSGDTIRIYSPNTAPVLYNQNSYNWENASVDWKPPVLGDLTAAIISNGSPSGSTYIGGQYLSFSNYSGTYYALSTDSTTAKTASFEFRITRNDQTISGTVTVNIKKVDKTPEQIQQENEKAELESLRDVFNTRFTPNASSYSGGVVSRFIDKDITAFGQTDVLYTISASGGWASNGTVNLPTKYGYNASNSYTNLITWTTKTANAAVVLSGTYLTVYANQTGTAEFSFTYTNSDNKTVQGTVKVTVIDSE